MKKQFFQILLSQNECLSLFFIHFKGAGSPKRTHHLRFIRFYASYFERVQNIKETYLLLSKGSRIFIFVKIILNIY